MRAPLDASSALARHPSEVASILAKVGAAAPAQVDWAYEAWVRIGGGYELGNELKGIDRFIHNAANQGLALEGRLASNPKKKARVDLDPMALSADPARCPVELYGLMDKPQGLSLWLWRPRKVASPGWNEAVIIGGITDGTTSLLRLYEDTCNEGYPVLLERTKAHPTWRETHFDASGRVDTFGIPLQATMGHYARTGELAGVSPASIKTLASSKIRPLNAQELSDIHASFPQGYVMGPDAAARIIQQMTGAFPGLPAPVQTQDTDTVWSGRIKTGRHFAWGQSIDMALLRDYIALKQDTGVQSGNALAVFSSLANPTFQDNRAIAAALLANLALGQSAEEALDQARTQVQSRPRRTSRF